MKLTRTTIGFMVGCFIMMGMITEAQTQPGKMKDDTAGMMSEPQMSSESAKMMAECRIDGRADMLQSTDEIMSMAVKNNRGAILGTAEELIVDSGSRVVRYVILSASDKLYPVPWTAFDTGMDTYTLDISRGSLREAPMMESIDISRLSDSDFQMKLNEAYSRQISAMQEKHKQQAGMSPEKTERVTAQPQKQQLLASNTLMGFDVNSMQGEKLGQLNDIVFDVRQGNLAYALISFRMSPETDRRIAAAPWDSIELKADQKVAAINADQTALLASVLPEGNLSRLCEPAFARQIHQGFNQEPYWEVFGFIAPAGTMPRAITGTGWAADSMYNKSFDVNAMKTISGTITKIGTFSHGRETSPGLKLRVETDQGQNITIYAGPEQYYLRQPVKLQRGDQIKVTGSQTMADQKSVIMACEIHKGTESFKIRDMQGKPLWME